MGNICQTVIDAFVSSLVDNATTVLLTSVIGGWLVFNTIKIKKLTIEKLSLAIDKLSLTDTSLKDLVVQVERIKHEIEGGTRKVAYHLVRVAYSDYIFNLLRVGPDAVGTAEANTTKQAFADVKLQVQQQYEDKLGKGCTWPEKEMNTFLAKLEILIDDTVGRSIAHAQMTILKSDTDTAFLSLVDTFDVLSRDDRHDLEERLRDVNLSPKNAGATRTFEEPKYLPRYP